MIAEDIPSVTTTIHLVTAGLRREAEDGMQKVTFDRVFELLNTPTRNDTDLFNLICLASGSHAAAMAYRDKGEPEAAQTMFGIGQEALVKAAEAYGELMAHILAPYVKN